MISSKFKLLIRPILKFRVYSLLNLSGLTLGLFCVMVLVTYVSFEHSYDKFHENGDRMYRVNEISTSPNEKSNHPFPRVVAGPALQEEIPEISAFNRMKISGGIFSYDKTATKAEAGKVLYSDPNFFSFYTFPLLAGDPESVLADKKSVVLTRDMANALFADSNPIGEIVTFDNQNYTVSAVAENPPKNSHIQFGAVIPLQNLLDNPDLYIGWNGGLATATFVMLNKGVSQQMVEAKLPGFLWDKINKDKDGSGFFTEYYLEPVSKIHLSDQVDWDNFNRADAKNILYMLGIAILVLFIACINYYLISKGILTLRIKELNIKKNIGAGKRFLLKQLFAETAMFFFAAFVLAIALMYALSNQIQNLFEYNFNIVEEHTVHILGYCLLVVTFIVSVFSLLINGEYAGKLSGLFSSGASSKPTRHKSLSVISGFQFLISIVLISAVIIVKKTARLCF